MKITKTFETNSDREIPLGCCLIHWKEGGHSDAVIGQLEDGSRYFACANWTAQHETRHELIGLIKYNSDKIERIEFIKVKS